MFSILLAATITSFAGENGLDPAAVPRLTPLNEPPAPEKFARPDALIDSAKLEKWLDELNVRTIVIDGRDAAAFRISHIPGARSIQSDLFQDPNLAPYFMPPPRAIAAISKQDGITPTTRIVVYDDDDGRLAARIWFTFHAFGHDHISILNGGFAKWRKEKRITSITMPTLDDTGTFVPLDTPRGACAFDDLPQYRMRVKVIGQLPTANLLDARARAEYMGDDVRGKFGGHIPGAVNLPWQSMTTLNAGVREWRTPAEIHAILRLSNVDKDFPIAIYDQAGGRSAHLYFTLWLMGYDTIRNYVGGWRDYGNRDDAEVEK
ncbi:MAG: rhodanese-like domain-containing protein [Planctomycetota bacterium]